MDNGKLRENLCETHYLEDGTPYQICDEDRGQDYQTRYPPDLDPCAYVNTPAGRNECRMMNGEPFRREGIDERYYQAHNQDDPPSIGWFQVDANIERTLNDSTPEWINRVSADGDWNYKKGDSDAPGKGYQRERAGNVNYGATCVAAGFHPDICLRAGGAYQAKTDYGDTKQFLPYTEERPWDRGDSYSCYGDRPNDCHDVLEGIRYGLDYLRRRKRWSDE